MIIEQFVMAYGVDQDRLRALLPEGFQSLRPVLRINAEIRDGKTGYLELNTAVEKDGIRGWLNIAAWENVPFTREGKTTVFRPDHLEISFTGVGIRGGCPAEKDNAGCFFPGRTPALRPSEEITSDKEFCDCRFRWSYTPGDARGVSIGKTLPAIPTPPRTAYPKQALTAPNAAKVPCQQVLGSYQVRFERTREDEQLQNDERFMRRAIELSRSAVAHGNEPFGAALVKDGEIVFENENQIYTRHDPTFHGEAGLIREFCAQTGITDLHEYTLYASCEPCFLCSGALVWVKLGRLVYGAGNDDLEALLGNRGCNCSALVFENSFWQPRVTSGVLRQESLRVLESYFAHHEKG